MEQWLNFFASTSKGGVIVTAVLIIAVTWLVARVAVHLTRKLLSSDVMPLSSSSLIVNVVSIAIWSVGVSVMLAECFGVNVGALIAALGIGGVALSLGLQDSMSNFIGGLQVTLLKIVQPGDHIKISSTEGMVLDVTLRQTIVKDFDNNIHTIPNAVINSGEVEKVDPPNLVATMISFTNDTRDLDETIRTMELLAKEAIEKVAELECDPWILLTQIGEYGTWAKLRFVLKDMTYAREARDAALRAISPYTRVNPENLPRRQ